MYTEEVKITITKKTKDKVGVSFETDVDFKQYLVSVAKAHDISVSSLINQILKEGIKNI